MRPYPAFRGTTASHIGVFCGGRRDLSPRTRSGVQMVARESGQFLDSCLRRNDEEGDCQSPLHMP
jgi:hypothetical protein